MRIFVAIEKLLIRRPKSFGRYMLPWLVGISIAGVLLAWSFLEFSIGYGRICQRCGRLNHVVVPYGIRSLEFETSTRTTPLSEAVDRLGLRNGHTHDDLTIGGGGGFILHDLRICSGPGYPALNVAMQARSAIFLSELAAHDPTAAGESLRMMLSPDTARTFFDAIFGTEYPESGFADESRFAEWYPRFKKEWSELTAQRK